MERIMLEVGKKCKRGYLVPWDQSQVFASLAGHI